MGRYSNKNLFLGFYAKKAKNEIVSRLCTYNIRVRLPVERSCKLAREDGAEALAEAETRHLGARHLVNSRRIVSRVSRIVWHSSLARYAETFDWLTPLPPRYKRYEIQKRVIKLNFIRADASGDGFHALYGGFGNVGMALLGTEISHRVALFQIVWSSFILLSFSFLFCI